MLEVVVVVLGIVDQVVPPEAMEVAVQVVREHPLPVLMQLDTVVVVAVLVKMALVAMVAME